MEAPEQTALVMQQIAHCPKHLTLPKWKQAHTFEILTINGN
jgi:hypothetical protein